MNKKEEYAFHQYLNATASELKEVYRNPSKAKHQIFERIKSSMLCCGGKRMRILSHSCHYFSCAYLFKSEDGKIYLAVFRPTKTFDVDVTETLLGGQFGA